MVPRSSVAALELLRTEMKEARDVFMANNAVANWCKANPKAVSISGAVLKEAAMTYAARVVSSGGWAGGGMLRWPGAWCILQLLWQGAIRDV
jgi:hypothetical protein